MGTGVASGPRRNGAAHSKTGRNNTRALGFAQYLPDLTTFVCSLLPFCAALLLACLVIFSGSKWTPKGFRRAHSDFPKIAKYRLVLAFIPSFKRVYVFNKPAEPQKLDTILDIRDGLISRQNPELCLLRDGSALRDNVMGKYRKIAHVVNAGIWNRARIATDLQLIFPRNHFARSLSIILESEDAVGRLLAARHFLDGKQGWVFDLVLSQRSLHQQPSTVAKHERIGIFRSSLCNVLNFNSLTLDRQQRTYSDDSAYYGDQRSYPNRENFWGYYFVPIARLLSPFIVLLGAFLQYKGCGVRDPRRWRYVIPGVIFIAVGWLLVFDPMRW